MTAETGQLEIFIEQAEYLETEYFQQWTIEHPDEELILKKLSQAGAKLITGPRGCGKTTLLLKAFHKLCKDNGERTLPIYVNFKASLKLEPFYKKSANAPFLFQQWLLYKIYHGLYETLSVLGASIPNAMALTSDAVAVRIQQLELGQGDGLSEGVRSILPAHVEKDIDRVLGELGYKRCVRFIRVFRGQRTQHRKACSCREEC